MIEYTAIILKFEKKGEKTGWTYIEIPESFAIQLNTENKKSFRVKGMLDNYKIKQVALIPMGNGNFIMPLNAEMRKHIGKRKGATLRVRLAIDKQPIELSVDLMTCLNDEPHALFFFKSLSKSHQNYFSKWIESAKTEQTKTKRIIQTVNAMIKKQGYSEMIRALKEEKK